MKQLAHPKLKGIYWIILTGLITASVAGGLPYLAGKIPWSVEIKLAEQLGEPPGRTCSAVAPNAVLNKIVSRLIIPGSATMQVHVIQGDSVNAFAMLGGRIYIIDALLKRAQSPEELAGVLAHEMAHVEKRHIVQGVIVQLVTYGVIDYLFSGGNASPQIFNALLKMQFTKTQEEEADELGLRRLNAAKISTEGFVQFFERMESDSVASALLSDHPAPTHRALMAKRYLTQDPAPLVTTEEWSALKKICN